MVIKTYVKDPLIVIPVMIIVVFVIVAVVPGQIAPEDPLQQNLRERLKSPDWSMEEGYPWVIFTKGQCKAMNTKYWTDGAAGTNRVDPWRYGDYNRPMGNDPMRVDGKNWVHNPEPWAHDRPQIGRQDMEIGMILDANAMNENMKKCCTREMSYENKGDDALVPCPQHFQTTDTDLIKSGLNKQYRTNREMCTWEELHCPTTLQKGNDCDIIMENWCKDANRKLGQGKWPIECQCIMQRIQMVDENGHQIDFQA